MGGGWEITCGWMRTIKAAEFTRYHCARTQWQRWGDVMCKESITFRFQNARPKNRAHTEVDAQSMPNPKPTLLSLSRFSDWFLGMTEQNAIHKDVGPWVPGYAECKFGVWRVKINFLQERCAKECVLSKYYEEFYEYYWLRKSLWGEHNDISWMGN